MSDAERRRAADKAARDLTDKVRKARGAEPINDLEWRKTKKVAAAITQEVIKDSRTKPPKDDKKK